MADINTHYSPGTKYTVSDFTATLARTAVQNLGQQLNDFLLGLYAFSYDVGRYYVNPLYVLELLRGGIQFVLDWLVGLFRPS